MYRAKYLARDLRRLCPYCRLRLWPHTGGLCREADLRVQWLRYRHAEDQASAQMTDYGIPQEWNWGADSHYSKEKP